MGMLSQRNNRQNGYQSGGTSSFPTTGFPASAYRGNNRMAGAGSQGQPSTFSGLTNVQQYDTKHLVIVIGLLIGVGYLAWHLDNRKR